MLPEPAATPLPTALATLSLAELEPVMAAWAAHVQREAPREACGLVLRLADGRLDYVALANLAAGPAGLDRFVIDPKDWAACEDAGRIVAVCHSHPNADAHPSEADRVMCTQTGITWAVMGWPSRVVMLAQPGYEAPLVGRSFAHGVLDCYTLIQDYYRRELGIGLPHFERADEWWVAQPGQPPQDLYRSQFEAAGFVEINGPMRAHDGLLMQVRANVENHAAIYTGDGCILHHLYGRLSTLDVWGGYWQRHTRAVVRHRSLLLPGDVLMPKAGP